MPQVLSRHEIGTLHMTTEPGSITQWLQRLHSGEADAAKEIWNRYYPRVVRLAALQLIKSDDRSIDEEDVAQSTFRTVYLAVMNGKYPDIEDRRDLWRLLLVSTLNRVRRHHRDSHTLKRSVNELVTQDQSRRRLIMEISGPDAQAEMADLIETLFRRLDQEDPTGELRQIALLKLEEHSASAIARRLKRRKNHVLQRIRLIRILWEESLFT
ncbi:MAG: hypothetical protein RL240_3127 [Planctomycetota bacterium]